MALLTDEQVYLIRERIKAEVSDAALCNDLLDHYCCFVEEQMDTGTNFETAYQKAFKAITPNGMHEIQEELFADNVKSIEPVHSKALGNAEGKDAVRRKGEAWFSQKGARRGGIFGAEG